jgi:hypothetical protein
MGITGEMKRSFTVKMGVNMRAELTRAVAPEMKLSMMAGLATVLSSWRIRVTGMSTAVMTVMVIRIMKMTPMVIRTVGIMVTVTMALETTVATFTRSMTTDARVKNSDTLSVVTDWERRHGPSL